MTNFVKCITYLLYIWLYSIITTRHLNIEESLKFNTAYVRFVNQSHFQNPRYLEILNFNTMNVFTDIQELAIQPTFITNNLTYNERPTYLIGRLEKQTYFMTDKYYSIPGSSSIVHWVGTNMRLNSRKEIGSIFVNSIKNEVAIIENSMDRTVGVWPYQQSTQLTPEILGESLASENLKILAQDLIAQIANPVNPFVSREVLFIHYLVDPDRICQSPLQPQPKHSQLIEEFPQFQPYWRSKT